MERYWASEGVVKRKEYSVHPEAGERVSPTKAPLFPLPSWASDQFTRPRTSPLGELNVR
jgi:hypothetical protein